MQQRLAGEWGLDKEKIRRFNRLKTNLMNAAWPLLNKYNLPDSARLTENNLKQYYQFISETDVEKAIRIGKRIESELAHFAPFWFHLGRFYLQAENIKDARLCFEKCEEINRPILRKDILAAANARYKIFTLNSNEREEAKRLVDIIEHQTPEEDWNNILFAALQNYQLGNKDKAEILIYQNIDNGFNVDVNKEILRQISQNKFDHNAIQSVMIKKFKEPSELEKLAEAGNAEAQYQCGRIALLGGSKDIAHRWLSKAGSQGHIFAKCLLIFNFDSSENKREAKSILQYIKHYAEDGNSEAQRLLGHFYKLGIIENKNFTMAFEWYQKAAEQGNSYAQSILGSMYADGYGVHKDLTKALEYYQKAAKQGDSFAQTELGVIYRNGYGVQKDLTKAIEWYQKAAEQNDAQAQNNLGYLYIYGNGVPKDMDKAKYWLEKSAAQGNEYAKSNLETYFNKR